jgi:streptogramin lyase
MKIGRREFFGAAVAGGALISGKAWPQGRREEVPARSVKVEKLYKSPDIHPNALEAAEDGLWVGDQISERVAKLDWETGKVLANFISEAHNTSGLAVGGGYLWLHCNGAGSAASMREKRPTDKPYGEIIKADMQNGKIVHSYRTRWGGGVHGGTYVHETDTLWGVALSISALAEMDAKDDLKILRIIPVKANVPHGIAWHDGAIWCMFAADRLAQKLDPDSGQVLDVVALGPDDPDPHGMCIHNGYMYFTDAGLGGGRPASKGTAPGYICRFKL